MDSREAADPSTLKLSVKELDAIKQEELLAQQDADSKKLLLESSAVQTNESDEILDKRQLLSGGLNLTFKAARKQNELEQDLITEKEKQETFQRTEKLRQQQERSRRFVEQQERQRKAQETILLEKEKKILVEKLATKVAPSTVLSAKERYLLRKQQQTEEA